MYPADKWSNFISSSMKLAKAQVKAKIKSSSNIKIAAADIEQTLNAEVAQAKFFGISIDEIAKKREVYETVLEALKSMKVELDAAAFVMVRKTHG